MWIKAFKVPSSHQSQLLTDKQFRGEDSVEFLRPLMQCYTFYSITQSPVNPHGITVVHVVIKLQHTGSCIKLCNRQAHVDPGQISAGLGFWLKDKSRPTLIWCFSVQEKASETQRKPLCVAALELNVLRKPKSRADRPKSQQRGLRQDTPADRRQVITQENARWPEDNDYGILV